MGTWIVGAFVFSIIGLAGYRVFLNKKSGGCCGCDGCGKSSESCCDRREN